MAASTDPNLSFSNIDVYGDLDGNILTPKVISVENIVRGVLPLRNGGLGISSFPYGKIPIGSSNNTIAFLTGNNDGDNIVWSSSINSWVPRRLPTLSDLIINFDNELFSLSSSIDNYGVKTYELSKKEVQPNTFYAGQQSLIAEPTFRKIENSDLPQRIENKILSDINAAGNFDGRHTGVFQGDFTGIYKGILSGTLYGKSYGTFDGRHTGDFTGDGYYIRNINPGNISQLNDTIYNVFLQRTSSLPLNKVVMEDVISKNFVSYNGLYYGKFVGTGEEITKIKPENILGLKNSILSSISAGKNIEINSDGIISSNSSYFLNNSDGNIKFTNFGSGSIADLSDDIDVNSITANTANIKNLFVATELNAKKLISERFDGKFFGDGSSITNISNDSLKFSYIKINNSPIYLGEEILLNTINGFSLGDNLNGSFINGSLFIGMNKNIGLDSLQSKAANFYSLSASSLYANILSGDGSSITNINANNIVGLVELLGQKQTIDPNLLVDEEGLISVNSNLQNLESISVNNINTQILSASEIQLDNRAFVTNLTSSRITVDRLYSNFIYGDGSFITNINPLNISAFKNAVLNCFSQGEGITLNSSGVLSATAQTNKILSVVGGTNIIGGGSSGILTLSLSNNISLNSIISNSITSSFVGNGSKLTNISYNQLTNLPLLSQYVTTSQLTSLSSSISSSFQNLNFNTSSLATLSQLQQLSSSLSSSLSNVSVNTSSLATVSQLNSLSSSITQTISASISNAITVDPTLVEYTVVSGSLSQYDVVALTSLGLSKADKRFVDASNAFGVISKFNSLGTTAYVKVCGEIQVNNLSTFTITGSSVWVGLNGAVCKYEDIGSGNYATQIGYLSKNNKIIIMPRVAYRIA